MSHPRLALTLPAPGADLRPVPYEHLDAQFLARELHRYQSDLYGFADDVAPTGDEGFDPPSGLFLVAYSDGAPVGCGGWRTLMPGTAEIKRMYVAPARRGHSLGHTILHTLEADARSAGATRMVLETGRDNHAALQLYARSGYHPVPSYVPGRNPDINRAMAKALA
ncbi:GNAT superfamily N-acetyltransferase [Streptacidiphilus sp. BW17]|uniref:GNAT family N-acetyltransferase n=1 Tax=Streptacidiphilus sp. BW17 TaxID=3156274 RepID=UPI0035175D0E